MLCIFDSNSPVMADVQEEGKPQLWNHKQNDALGLYLDLLIQAINTGTINAEDWQKGDRLKSVVNRPGFPWRVFYL